jgi:hypothetical protein
MKHLKYPFIATLYGRESTSKNIGGSHENFIEPEMKMKKRRI